jgi:hypothetical protein
MLMMMLHYRASPLPRPVWSAAGNAAVALLSMSEQKVSPDALKRIAAAAEGARRKGK